jgi:benzoyl-CoA reductase subunit C
VAASLEALVERAEALYRDASLASVRAWKGAHPGAKAIGYLPIYGPLEVIHAAGMLPVGLYGGGDGVEIVKGDAYFQSYICHLPRSTVEMGLSGALDPLDGVVFPSTCDVIRNLSGMWQLLFPKKYVRYLDLPQTQSEVGVAFFEDQLRDLARDLHALGGAEVTTQRLRASIADFDESRRLVRELLRLREDAFWLVPASELYLILRAGNVLPVEEHCAMLAAYLEAAKASGRRPVDMARVAVRGLFCEQPPVELLRTLERAGCTVVDDDAFLALRWFPEDVGGEGDPFHALARAFAEKSPSCPSLYRHGERKGDALLEAVRRSRAEGVVFAAPSFCDPALLDQPMTMGAAREAGVPCTSFLFSESTGQFQPIREQAGTFADAIKLA